MLFGKTKRLKLGECCKALNDALTVPHKSHFFEEDSGIYYVTIGAVQVDGETAWLDQALRYCPFCGASVQTDEQIQELAQKSAPLKH
jgi:hypothetical protein